MATKKMTIKLMIDPESNSLIFAEASKDFVDFLINLLSLPIGTVTKLLRSESMVGSIGNVYTSVAHLDKTYWRPNVDKYKFLDPMVLSSLANIPLSEATRSYINSSQHFYTCFDTDCERGGISNAYDVDCPGCDRIMTKGIQFIDNDSEGYVHNVASYMISDDLSITPISTMSIVSMLNKFNVTKPEEREVKIGSEEALELLKASLESTTVLTDVFLKRKKIKQPGDDGRIKMKIGIRTLTGNMITLEVEPSDTIYCVKTKLEDIHGLHPKHGRLIFEGHNLRDGRTLADCNVVNKSILQHILQLKGC